MHNEHRCVELLQIGRGWKSTTWQKTFKRRQIQIIKTPSIRFYCCVNDRWQTRSSLISADLYEQFRGKLQWPGRVKPEQVDTRLGDGINKVLAHYNQHAQCMIPRGGCVCVSSLRSVHVCKYTVNTSRILEVRHIGLQGIFTRKKNR